jgi:hypothetical protein
LLITASTTQVNLTGHSYKHSYKDDLPHPSYSQLAVVLCENLGPGRRSKAKGMYVVVATLIGEQDAGTAEYMHEDICRLFAVLCKWLVREALGAFSWDAPSIGGLFFQVYLISPTSSDVSECSVSCSPT